MPAPDAEPRSDLPEPHPAVVVTASLVALASALWVWVSLIQAR